MGLGFQVREHNKWAGEKETRPRYVEASAEDKAKAGLSDASPGVRLETHEEVFARVLASTVALVKKYPADVGGAQERYVAFAKTQRGEKWIP